MKTLWRRFLATFRGSRLDAELDAEVGLHLQMLEEEHRARGLSAEEARHAARRDFGGVAQTQESYRGRRGLPWLETLWQDLRYGARMLGNNPGFAAVASITLALGIGANATIFSAMNALVLRPLRLKEPDRLVMIREVRTKGGGRLPTRGSSLAWHKRSRLFEAIERGGFGGDPANLTGIGRAERVRVAYCTPGYLAMLGAQPRLGRVFHSEEGPPEPDTAVIGAEMWRRVFAGDPEILGKVIAIEGKAETIVGVLPDGFSIAPFDMHVDVWIANAHALAPDTRWMPVVGRMKPGVTVEQAAAELTGMLQGQPGADKEWTVRVEELQELFVGGARQMFWILFFAVGFVLLIACVNVANLLLARAAARQKEIAVRVSLGAGRWRLTRQLLAESALLALIAGALGVGVGLAGNRVFLRIIPLGEATLALPMDWRVLAFTLALSLVTGLVFGLAPALRAWRPDLHASLKEGRGQSGGRSGQRSQNVLLVLETALAMVLLVGAGLLINSFIRLQNVELGFNPKNVLRADVKLAGNRYVRQMPSIMKQVTPEGDQYFAQLLDRIKTIPGVRVAGISHLAPPGDVQMRSLRVIGRPAPPTGRELTARFNEVGGAYFEALEIPLRRGRYVNDRDAEGAPWVVNINETMAKRYFPDEDPLGKMVQVKILGGASGVNVEEDRPRQILGIVADVRHFGAYGEFEPVMYASYRQHVTEYPGGYYIGHLWKSITIKTAGDPLGIVNALQKAAAEVDKDQPLFGIQTLEKGVEDSLGGGRFLMRLFGVFAALALGLAAVGIYGVMSYLVAQRTHEIGIRVALGARSGDVLRMVIGRGMTIAAIGLAVGIGGSLLLTKMIGGTLFGVKTTDPLTYLAVSLVLLAVALAACWLPARRALKIDPLVALRHE